MQTSEFNIVCILFKKMNYYYYIISIKKVLYLIFYTKHYKVGCKIILKYLFKRTWSKKCLKPLKYMS